MVNKGDLDRVVEVIAQRIDEATTDLRRDIAGTRAQLVTTIQECESRMKDQLKDTETRMNNMIESKISALEKRLERVEKEDPLNLLHDELDQMERRHNNIVIHGLEEAPEGQMDGVKVKKVFCITNPEEELNYQVLYRTGQRDPRRPRALVIRFKEAGQKDRVLINATKLRGEEEFKKVYLAADLTKKQRERSKQKEEDLKEEANGRNQGMTGEEKNEWKWVVVGRDER